MASNSSSPTAQLVDPLTGLRRMLYIVTPWESSFPQVEQVPKFVDEAIPYFILLMLVEYAVLTCQGKRRRVSIADGIGSISGGIVSQLPLLLARSIELSAYIWVYDNFRIVDIAWNSTFAWLAALVGVDFAYYWVHRFAHEVNLFWSGHQMHHSSENYNLSTALRQSVLQRYFSWFFYLPLALLLPPPLFATHLQFNLLYQFWIHTEVIDQLPWPIEFIFNTPSHHRVHHGRNPYCIDKNYAGTLIIFDRMFGTFAAERNEEQVVYGLITPVRTLDPFWLQLHHLQTVFKQVQQQHSATDKLRALFYGPGWQRGTRRLGDGAHPPVEQSATAWQPTAAASSPSWVTTYATLHFIISVIGYAYLATSAAHLPVWSLLSCCGLILLTLSSVARLIEQWGYAAAHFELLRCVALSSLCAMLHTHRPPTAVTSAAQAMYIACSCLWMCVRMGLLPVNGAAAAAGKKKGQ